MGRLPGHGVAWYRKDLDIPATDAGRSIFLDIDGVWVHAGVLPWSRGVFGIRYRDLDDPVLMQNLASWLFRSHTIVLRHRFASQAPIALDHMSNAPAALERIFRAQRVAEGHPLTGTFNN